MGGGLWGSGPGVKSPLCTEDLGQVIWDLVTFSPLLLQWVSQQLCILRLRLQHYLLRNAFSVCPERSVPSYKVLQLHVFFIYLLIYFKIFELILLFFVAKIFSLCFFNQRIIALHCCVDFCHTTTQISNNYIYPLPLEPSSPFPSHPWINF